MTTAKGEGRRQGVRRQERDGGRARGVVGMAWGQVGGGVGCNKVW